MRALVIFSLWLVTLGLFEVDVVFVDGLRVHLRSWPNVLRAWSRER